MKKLLAAILLILLSSCELLTTREPQEPKTPSSNFIAATQPEIVFQNLKYALEEKVLENYMACFVDSTYLKKKFAFTPAVGTVTQYPNLMSWDLRSESEYFNRLKTQLEPNSKISFSYEFIEKSRLSDSANFRIDYNIVITSNVASVAGEYQGISEFKLFSDSRSQWSIVEWNDIKKENLFCWSDLKGRTH